MFRILSLWILGIYVLCDGSDDQIRARKIHLGQNKLQKSVGGGVALAGAIMLAIVCINPPAGIAAGVVTKISFGAFTGFGANELRKGCGRNPVVVVGDYRTKTESNAVYWWKKVDTDKCREEWARTTYAYPDPNQITDNTSWQCGTPNHEIIRTYNAAARIRRRLRYKRLRSNN